MLSLELLPELLCFLKIRLDRVGMLLDVRKQAAHVLERTDRRKVGEHHLRCLSPAISPNNRIQPDARARRDVLLPFDVLEIGSGGHLHHPNPSLPQPPVTRRPAPPDPAGTRTR